jgi:hypothetical protein
MTDWPVTGVTWSPLDTAAKLKQQNLLTNTYVGALRELAPGSGAYINEVRVSSMLT